MAIGIGASRAAATADLLLAVARMEDLAGRSADAVSSLEGAAFSARLAAAVAAKGIAFQPLALTALQQRSGDCASISKRVVDLFGVASIAESAALTAAGPGSRLLVTRQVFGNITAAAAISSDDQGPAP
ncbi:MAG: cobalamin biosynthesis protein [Hyphomicrobium sp.]